MIRQLLRNNLLLLVSILLFKSFHASSGSGDSSSSYEDVRSLTLFSVLDDSIQVHLSKMDLTAADSEYLRQEILERIDYEIVSVPLASSSRDLMEFALDCDQYAVLQFLLSKRLFHEQIDEIFIAACATRKIVAAQILLEYGANIHASWETALRNAIIELDLPMIKFLVERGADINYGNGAALVSICPSGRLDIVKYLVESGANVHSLNDLAVLYTIESNHLPILQYLHERGAHIRLANDYAILAAARKNHTEIVRYLVRNGADFNVRHGEILTLACGKGNIELVRFLVEVGSDVNLSNGAALQGAASQGHFEIVEFLLSQGAIHHSAALIDSVKAGHLRIVQLLVEGGADLEAFHEQAVIIAAKNGHLDILEYAVRNLAKIHVMSDEALFQASERGHYDIVRFLVERGADVEVIEDDELRQEMTTIRDSIVASRLNSESSLSNIPDSHSSLESNTVSLFPFAFDSIILPNTFDYFDSVDISMLSSVSRSIRDRLLNQLLIRSINHIVTSNYSHLQLLAEVKSRLNMRKLNQRAMELLAEWQESLFNWAVICEQHDIVEFFISHRLCESEYSTSFLSACARRNHLVADLLLNNGVDIHFANDGALVGAVRRADFPTIKFLIELGANINVNHGHLFFSPTVIGRVRIVKYLVEHGIDVRGHGNLALRVALENNYIRSVGYLVESVGVDPRADNDFALRMAARWGHFALLKYFIELGADVRLLNGLALTSITKLVRPDILKYLVERGSDLHFRNESVLIIAASNGDLESVEFLISRGAEIYVHSDLALRSAASRGHSSVVKCLLEHGSDVHSDHDVALIEAVDNGHLEVVKLLVKHGANIRSRSNEPLFLAAYRGHHEIVKLFLENGASLDSIEDEDLRGRTFEALTRNKLI